MAIDFSLTENSIETQKELNQIAREHFRPASREFDENEHDMAWDLINFMWNRTIEKGPESWENSDGFVRVCMSAEELCWGDAGLYLNLAGGGLGGTAVGAVGTDEQKKRFLAPFNEGEPKWGAMAITEPGAGSDASAIQATAEADGDERVLNGTKIFCTAGKAGATIEGSFVVVWATLDREAGRAGIKSFVVPANTPGMTVTGLEKKLGIRASQTATLTLENCRIPKDYILGSAEVKKKKSNKGFKGAMATFDASRPVVAAMGVGVGRAALDFVKEELEKQGRPIRYDTPMSELTAVERDVIEMEADLQAARLLTWRSGKMMEWGKPNNLETSMAKAKAGLAVTKITQKAVEILGPLGYSRKILLEKWMRDAKINDIFEGTQQINQLIVARRILDYSSGMLR